MFWYCKALIFGQLSETLSTNLYSASLVFTGRDKLLFVIKLKLLIAHYSHKPGI